MPRAWLSLGSNIDRERNIRSAVRALEERFGELVISPVYESEAVGFDSNPFYNLVVGIESKLPAERLQQILHEIEADHGRRRGGAKLAARTLDIDLLTYGDRLIHSTRLNLPRDEIVRYAFVLKPLSEVAGEERHPGTGKRYRELWEAFDAKTQPLIAVPLTFVTRRAPVSV